VLIGIGVALWAVTMAINRATGQKVEEPRVEDLSERGMKN